MLLPPPQATCEPIASASKPKPSRIFSHLRRDPEIEIITIPANGMPTKASQTAYSGAPGRVEGCVMARVEPVVETSSAGALDDPMVKVSGVMLQVMCRLSRLGVLGPLEQLRFSVPEPCSAPPFGFTGVKMKLADCPARIVAVFPVLPPPGVVESMVTGNWVVVRPFCPAAPGRFAKSLGALIT